jgi:hypothetical protein
MDLAVEVVEAIEADGCEGEGPAWDIDGGFDILLSRLGYLRLRRAHNLLEGDPDTVRE